MVRMFLCLVLVFAEHGRIYGQQDGASKSVTHRMLLERLSGASATSAPLTGTSLPPAEVVGDAFLIESFAPATFLLMNDKTTPAYDTKYDIQRDVFYYKLDEKIYVLTGDQVKSFFWFNPEVKQQETFVNKRDFETAAGTVLPGFLQVLADGSLPLLKGTNITILDPNYNFSRAIGRQDYSVVKKTQLYYVEDGIVNALPERDKVMALFALEHRAAIMKFIEHNDFRLSEESELTEVFKYYNYRQEQ
jgi:hypothetical protein